MAALDGEAAAWGGHWPSVGDAVPRMVARRPASRLPMMGAERPAPGALQRR
jgi:hypothetical protein